MTYILTKMPTVEDLLADSIKAYLLTVNWGEFYPNYADLNISNDHPFEELLSNANDSTTPRPNLFPSITVVASNDGEVPGMAKGWKVESLSSGDLDSLISDDWYMPDTTLNDFKAALVAAGKVYGLSHTATWRDSVSIEIWANNAKVKNDIYNLCLAYLQGPGALGLKQSDELTIFSGSIQGQRSGYYNFDFGRTLFGGRISFNVDYLILQAAYDTTIVSLEAINHTYKEIING
jgi:hypothetical protein